MYKDPEGFFPSSETYAGYGTESVTAESSTAVLGVLPDLHPAIAHEFTQKFDTKYLLEFCELLIDAGLVDMENVTPQPVETFIGQHITEFKRQVGVVPTLHRKVQTVLNVDYSIQEKLKFAECMIDAGVVDYVSAKPMPVTQFLKTHLNTFIENHLGKLKCFKMEVYFDVGEFEDQFHGFDLELEPDDILMTINNRPNGDLWDFVFEFDSEKKFLDNINPRIMKTLFWIFNQLSPYVGGIGTAEWFCDDYPPSVIYALMTEDEREEDTDLMYEMDEKETLEFFRKRATKAEADVVNPKNSVFAAKSYKQMVSKAPEIQPLLDHIRAMQQFIHREMKSGLWLDETVDQKYFPFFIPIVNSNGSIWEIISEKNNSDCGDYCYMSTQKIIKIQPEFFSKFAVSLKAISMLDTCIHLLKQLPVSAQAN